MRTERKMCDVCGAITLCYKNGLCTPCSAHRAAKAHERAALAEQALQACVAYSNAAGAAEIVAADFTLKNIAAELAALEAQQ